MSNFEIILADASRLPVEQRVQLIEALWNTVPEDSLPPLSAEWAAEIERRSAEYDAGNATTTPREVVREEALRRINRRAE